MKTSAATFIENVKNNTCDGQFYYIAVKKYPNDGESEDCFSEEVKSIILTGEEDARAEMKKMAASQEPDETEYYEVCVCVSELVITESLKPMTEEESQEFLIDCARSEQDQHVIDHEMVFPSYKSIEGDIIVAWRWEKHIGYARSFIEIREGEKGEDESLFLPVDKVTAVQCSRLMSAEERKGMSREEMEPVIETRLNSIGKWNHASWKYITNAISDAAEKYSK